MHIINIKTKHIISAGIFFFLFMNSYSLASSIHKKQNSINKEAIKELIERIAPDHSSDFIIETITDNYGNEIFELAGRGNKIVLRGNSTLAITRAFNWYLNWSFAVPICCPSMT